MKTSNKITTTTETLIELSAIDIMELLSTAGKLPKEGDHQLMSVSVHVPGGGDWSHADLSIDDHHPVVIRLISKTDE